MKGRAPIVFLMTFALAVAAACGGSGSGPRAVALGAHFAAHFAAFEPSTITIAKGQAVKLKLTSHDMGHTFTIDELGIHIAVGGGQTVTQEIKVDTAGTYTFYCSVSGHRDAGMNGTLKVTE